MKSKSTNSYQAFSLFGRVLLAAVFLVSGLGKLATASATMGFIASVGLPSPMLGYAVALTLEIGGGVLLIVGYQTRVVAALLAVFSIVTALFFHHAFADQNQTFHFLKNLAIAGGLLQIVTFGAGAYSLDGRRGAPEVSIA
ncbi:DoxX family protein [Paraburkholderia sp. LEh10]|uniref:DoxX family protein n=1 Tax=Paraburkholderia sp. LEh10 TaxID=2821353 RepID=UPI001AE9CD24|nr:DoxX family protein [Paraburkholderia sp. LEh10]MBP0593270.1 DoxX family protein [Paraburkholderia sp. LEh10]